jgi:hypothetical protein
LIQKNNKAGLGIALPCINSTAKIKKGGEVMQRIKSILVAMAIMLFTTSFSYAQGGYECIDCHEEPPPPPPLDCLSSGCHDTYDNGNHHTTGWALAGMCTPCHNPNIVADYDNKNPYSYPASATTPTVESCNNCHKAHENPLDENGDPYPFPIYDTQTLEHMDWQGYSGACYLCHGDPPNWDPNDPYLIRYCETCHSTETLHAIPGHSEGGFWYDENGVWTEITADDRCLNCHGSPPEVPGMLYVPQPSYATYDTTYSEIDQVYCRSCHGSSLAARHHALYGPCSDPPAPPVIDTNACDGMTPIVGAEMARVTLTGTNFGQQVSLKCGDYKVQMEDGDTWVDLPVTNWTDTLIDWTLPSWTFVTNHYYNARVITPTGNSNIRNFFVLPIPVVDRIEDDTGGNTKGPTGRWLTVYSTMYGSEGTFSDAREKWYEDPSGGICPNFFGSIYVVTLTSTSDSFCATIYDEWNASGNKDSFKVQLADLWKDNDGDYFKDDNEPLCGPGRDCDISPGLYSVQVNLIIYTDSNGDDKFSGDEDTIHQVVKSKSDITYNISTAVCECNLVPDATSIPRGGTLGFQGTITNDTNKSGTVLFATDVTKPDENRYPPSGYLIEPLEVYLSPYQSKSGYRSHTIPLGAPLGIYTYHGYVGRYGVGKLCECQFEFEVVEQQP